MKKLFLMLLIFTCVLTVNTHAAVLSGKDEEYTELSQKAADHNRIEQSIIDFLYNKLNDTYKNDENADGLYGFKVWTSSSEQMKKKCICYTCNKITKADDLKKYNVWVVYSPISHGDIVYCNQSGLFKEILEKIYTITKNNRPRVHDSDKPSILIKTERPSENEELWHEKDGEDNSHYIFSNIIWPSDVLNLDGKIALATESDIKLDRDKDNKFYFDKDIILATKTSGDGIQTDGYYYESCFYTSDGIMRAVYDTLGIEKYKGNVYQSNRDGLSKVYMTNDISNGEIFTSDKLQKDLQILEIKSNYNGDTGNTSFEISLANGIFEGSEKSYESYCLDKARDLALAMTSISSYADGDYLYKSVVALNGMAGTKMYKDIRNKEVKEVLNDALILLKFRQPLYKSNSNSNRANTTEMKAAFVKDLLYSEKLTLYINNTYGDRTINVRRSTGYEKDKIFETDEEEQNTLAQTLGLLDQGSSEKRLDNVDRVLAEYNNIQADSDQISGTKTPINSIENKILTIDNDGYLNNSQSYINWLYFQKLKDDVTFTSRVDLMTPLFIDGVGNIVTENNTIVLPAISNSTIMAKDLQQNNNYVFYNSKCLLDAFQTKTEISSNVYNSLMNTYRLEIEDTSRLDTDNVEYIVTQHFGLRKLGNAYYLTVNDLNIKLSDGLYNINRDWYNKNKPALCANAIYSVLRMQQDKINIPINNVVVTAKDDGRKFTLGKSMKDMYNEKIAGITFLVLCGYKVNNLTEVTGTLLRDYDFSLPTLALLDATDKYSKYISPLFPSFLHNSANIFETHIGDRNLLDIYQLVLIVLLFAGLIVILIKLMVSFSIEKATRIIFTYLLSVLLIAGSTSAVGWIQYAVQNILADDAQRTLAMRSIVESSKDYRISATTKLSFLSDTARIKLEERDVSIRDKVESVVKVGEFKRWSDLYNEELERNSLRNGGATLDFDSYAYYMNISRLANCIGIRQVEETSSGNPRVFLTYDENVSLSCAYFPILPIMQVYVDRMNDFIEFSDNYMPSSTIDKQARKKYKIDEINNTYGLTYWYYLYTSQLNSLVKDEYNIYEGGYDVTGLAALLKPYFTEGDARFQGNAASDTCESYKGNLKKNGLTVLPSYSDEADITLSGKKFKPVNTSILDTFYVDRSQWIKGVLADENQDKVLQAIADANEAFRKSLAEIYQLSATLTDRDIILYCATNASLAFNKRLGNFGNTYNVNDFSNDLILNYAQFGRLRFLGSSGRTITRYMFENSTSGITAFTNLLGVILFDVLSLLKFILITIAILSFIYSVILNGVMKSNAAGIMGTVSLYAGIHIVSSLFLTLSAIIANIVNDVSLLSIINLVVIILLCYITLATIKLIAKNATNGGIGIFVKDVAKNAAALAVGAGTATLAVSNAIRSRYNNISNERFMQSTVLVDRKPQNNVVVQNFRNTNNATANKISVKTGSFSGLGV